MCFSCLEQVLLYTASSESDPVLASAGLQLTQSILSTHMRTIYSSLVTAAPARLICACLCLLSAMVTQGPAAAREVLQGFNFGYKPLGLLLAKTEKIKVCLSKILDGGDLGWFQDFDCYGENDTLAYYSSVFCN